MKINIYNITLQACLAFSILLVSSCTKNFDGFVEDPSTNRAFVPTELRTRTSQDTAIISWRLGTLASGKKYTYKVEVSTDSLFGTVDYTETTDTLGIKVLDPELTVNKTYYTRVRVEPFLDAGASNWVRSASSFRISGQQFLKVIRDFEITGTSVTLHWYLNSGSSEINKVILTGAGSATSVDVSPGEAQAGEKVITGLTPNMNYSVQLLAGQKSKGLASFSTPKVPVYTRTLSSGEDLAAAITAAAHGDVIGLDPGTYTINSFYSITNKNVTVRSTSNNPADTRLKIRELNLVGDSAGVSIIGVDIDGNYSGSSNAAAFLQLKGAGANGNAAIFGNIRFDNCYIHNFTRAIMIANHGSAANNHRLPSLTINNCRVYNINGNGNDGYYMFTMEKLLILNLNLSRSTFYSLGAGLFNMSTNLSSTLVPKITVDYCTFNNLGSQAKYLFIDANANKIDFNFRNSILANSPITGTINATAFRATNTSSALKFTNNNFFKLNSAAAGGSKINLTGLAQSGNYEIDLGWSSATTDFNLRSLATDSPIFKASTGGNTIGDPRWAY